MNGIALFQGKIIAKVLKYPENFLKSSPEPASQIQSN
jgi:hypothetical protein